MVRYFELCENITKIDRQTDNLLLLYKRDIIFTFCIYFFYFFHFNYKIFFIYTFHDIPFFLLLLFIILLTIYLSIYYIFLINYKSFYISDPKLRHIHKAEVVDRVLHHAIVKIIEPIFEKSFIFDSYSNRKNKGTHRAIKRFKNFAWKLSQNNTKNVWVLKCDIKKFFENVNHNILISLIERKISDSQVIKLISKIVYSFKNKNQKGIPLGNLTSQLFSNIYLSELDQFIKRKLKIKYYIRYTDDFVILSRNNKNFCALISKISEFLEIKLDLQIHPQKVMIKKWRQGIDFLGYVDFPYHNILRTTTKNRILKRIKYSNYQSIQSYLGILKHCRSHGIKRKINFLINK